MPRFHASLFSQYNTSCPALPCSNRCAVAANSCAQLRTQEASHAFDDSIVIFAAHHVQRPAIRAKAKPRPSFSFTHGNRTVDVVQSAYPIQLLARKRIEDSLVCRVRGTSHHVMQEETPIRSVEAATLVRAAVKRQAHARSNIEAGRGLPS